MGLTLTIGLAAGCMGPAVLDESFKPLLDPHFACVTRTLDPYVVYELNELGPDGFHTDDVINAVGRAVQDCGGPVGSAMGPLVPTTEP